MNATFRQLRLFLALVDEGSISRAARVCHVTQPTASMQLKELSLSVGLPIYEVIGKTIHLTEIGMELAKTARAMLDHVLQYSAIGTGEDVARGIDRFVANTGVDEVIIASSIFDHAARKRSLSITADAVMKVAA